LGSCAVTMEQRFLGVLGSAPIAFGIAAQLK
jgi:hypothetical protein